MNMFLVAKGIEVGKDDDEVEDGEMTREVSKFCPTELACHAVDRKSGTKKRLSKQSNLLHVRYHNLVKL